MSESDMVSVTIPRWFAERMRLNAARERRLHTLNARHAKRHKRTKHHAQFTERAGLWDSVCVLLDAALESSNGSVDKLPAPDPTSEVSVTEAGV